MQNRRMRQSLKRAKRLISICMAGILMLPLSAAPKISAKSEDPEVVMAALKGRGFKAVEDLGPIVGTPNVSAAVFNTYEGRLYAYAASVGDLFSVVDVERNLRVDLEEMSGVGTAYAHQVTPDGKVYVAGDKGLLYVYNPETMTAQKIGTVLDGHQVWSTASDEAGNVYFGTYKAGGAHVVKYNVSSKTLEDLGEADPVGKSDYVRSMSYKDGKLYLGLGLAAKVHVMDLKDHNKITDITPDNLHERIKKDPAEGVVQYVYSMGIAGNTLMAHVDNGKKDALLFYHIDTQKWDDKVVLMDGVKDAEGYDFGVWNFTHLPVYGDYAYLIHDRHLMEINHKTLEIREKITKYPSGLRGGTVILKDGNPVVLTISRGGEIVFMDVAAKATTRATASVMGAPLGLHNLAAGNDGNLYMTTYPGGPKGAKYNTKTGEIKHYDQGQAEGIIAGKDNTIYFGIYPGAIIQSMDTTDVGKFTNLFEMKKDYEQDRPYIMKYEDGLLLIGTIPDYGKTGGALAIYNPADNTQKVYKNIVDKQSIVGLAKKDDFIYGSTSTRGGLGIDAGSPLLPTEPPKIFVWDIKGETKIGEYTLDIPGLNTPMISGLTFDKDGNLWGAADGILFTWDTVNNKVLKYKNLYPEISNRGMWRPVHIKFGDDGLMYTDIAGKMTVIDYTNENWDFVTLPTGGKEVDFMELAYDSEGRQNVYFLDNGATSLKMIQVIDGGWVQQPPKTVEYPTTVANGGFETYYSELSGWTTDNAVLSEAQKYNGKYSMLVEGGTATSGNIMNVQSGGAYEVSAQVYAVSGSAINAQAASGSAIVSVEFYDIAGTPLGSESKSTTSTNAWEKVIVSGTAPVGSAIARIVARSSESAYFDAFTMTSTPIPMPNNELLVNGDFGNGLNNWVKRDQANAALADVIVDKAPGTNGEIGAGGNSAKFTDKSSAAGVFLISDRMNVIPGTSYNFKFNLFLSSGSVAGTDKDGKPTTQPNRCSVYVRYYDTNNNKLTPEVGKSYSTGQGTWQSLTEASTAPSGAVTAEVWIGLSPFYMAEHIYFSNLSFKSASTGSSNPITLSVPNSSLEENRNLIPGWSSWGGPWSSCSYQIDGSQKFEGNVSLKLMDSSTSENIFMVSDPIALVPDVKSHKASVRMMLPDGSATLMMRYYDVNDKQVGQDIDGVNIIHVQTNNNEWRKIEAIVPVPEGATTARIWLGMNRYFTSTGVYYDDARLVGLAEKYTLEVGKGSGSGEYREGEIIPIIADNAPTGMKFDRWIIVSGNGQIENAMVQTTNYTVGNMSALIKAQYITITTPVDPVNPPATPTPVPPVTPSDPPLVKDSEKPKEVTPTPTPASATLTPAAPVVTVEKAVNTVVGGKATVKIEISKKTLTDTVKDGNTKVDLSLSGDLLKEVLTDSKVKKGVVIDLALPVVNDASVNQITLSNDALLLAKKSGQKLTINVADEKGYTVSIPASELKKITTDSKDLNIAVSLQKDKEAASKAAGVLTIGSEGTLTAGMVVTVPVKDLSVNAGDKVYVYYKNAATGKLEEIPNNKKTVEENGSLKLSTISGGDYVICTEPVKDSVKLVDKAKVSIKSSVEVGKKLSVNISLPKELAQVAAFAKGDPIGKEEAKITYKVNNSSIATVSGDGTLIAKKKGLVEVTVEVTLENGDKKTFTKKIRIK